MVAFLVIMFQALSYRCWYMLFHAHMHFGDIGFLNGSDTSAVDGENFPYT